MHSYRHHKETHPDLLVANQLLATLSTQGVFQSFSVILGTLTGWSEADWLGKPLQSFVHPFDINSVKDRFAEVLSGRTVKLENIRCSRTDGSYMLGTLTLVPEDEGGGIRDVLMLGHVVGNDVAKRDIGNDHPLEGMRNRSSTIVEYAGLGKLLEGMLGNAPIGFALMDEDLRFICLNQAFAEMTGFSPSQHLGKTVAELLPRVAVLIEPVMQNVLAAGEPVTDYEAEFHQKDAGSSYCYAQMGFYPIPDLHGGVCGVATIALDITARKGSEAKLKKSSEELSRSNLALEQFSYVASHDLREPLRTISSFVQLLRDRYKGKLDEQADSFIAYSLDGAKRMENLIDKLLEYSKAGRADRALTEVDCGVLVGMVVENLRTALEENQVSVTVDNLPTVQSDESLLSQIFQNLIANAVKFRGTSLPKIHISGRRELNAVVFSVEDNGIGIDPEKFLDVFAPFRRLHSESEYAGSGLGLAICQKNVEKLGGRIWVTSEPDKGSTFSFTIPVTATGGQPSDENIR